MEKLNELSKEQLIDKISGLNDRLAQLEHLQSKCNRLEAELQLSEEKYRVFFENNDAIILFVNPDNGKIIFANQAARLFYGHNSEKWETLTVNDLNTLPPVEIKLKMAEARSKKQNYFVFKHKLADGEIRDVEVYQSKLHLNGQDVFSIIVHDITERKLAEGALSEKTAFLNKIINSSALSTWISDANGIAIQTNPACLDFFGATEKEVVGKYDLLKDEVIEKQGFMPQIKRVFEKGEVANIVIDYSLGEVYHVEVKNATHRIINSIFTPVFDDTGKLTNVIIQSIDLTEIKLAEKHLQETSTLLSEILNTIPIRVFWKDVDSTYLGCNLPFAKDAGLESPEDVIGKNDFDLFVKVHAENFRADDKLVIDGGLPKIGFEEPQENFEGFDHWLRTSKVPLRDKNGGMIGVLGTYEDITEKKQVEEELKKYREELEELVQQRTSELETKNKELSNALKVFVGRELTIRNLQERIKALERR